VVNRLNGAVRVYPSSTSDDGDYRATISGGGRISLRDSSHIIRVGISTAPSKLYLKDKDGKLRVDLKGKTGSITTYDSEGIPRTSISDGGVSHNGLLGGSVSMSPYGLAARTRDRGYLLYIKTTPTPNIPDEVEDNFIHHDSKIVIDEGNSGRIWFPRAPRFDGWELNSSGISFWQGMQITRDGFYYKNSDDENYRVKLSGKTGEFTLLDNNESKIIDIGENKGDILLRDSAKRDRISLSGNTGNITLRNNNSRSTISLDGNTGKITVIGSNEVSRAVLQATASGSYFLLKDSTGKDRIGICSGNGYVSLRDSASKQRIFLNGSAGDISLRNNMERERISMSGRTGNITLRNNNSRSTISLDGNTGIITSANQDLAEEFEVTGSSEPGTVMVIEKKNKLRSSYKAYDKKVAGVVSGINEKAPGIILGRKNSPKSKAALALTGKVYCKVDTEFSPIQVGDMLTTSPTEGHAMKAQDPIQAFGAVIGKALEGLKNGKGTIPMIVSLQ